MMSSKGSAAFAGTYAVFYLEFGEAATEDEDFVRGALTLFPQGLARLSVDLNKRGEIAIVSWPAKSGKERSERTRAAFGPL